MGGFALKPMSSGDFAKASLTVSTAEMSTTASPTFPPPLLTADQVTVVAASFSSLVFFVVIVVLLSVIYRKDPQCCRLRSYQGPDMVAPPQYYSSRQTLVGASCLEQNRNDEDDGQGSHLFYIGLPSSYSLPTLEAPLPRLPSYESVRKKDRQRQIHMMIADRFGLNGPIVSEPPPSYEESMRQSVEVPYNILLSGSDASPPQSDHANVDTDQRTDPSRPPSSILPV